MLSDATVSKIDVAGVPEPVRISPDEILAINEIYVKAGQVTQHHDYDGHLIRCRARLLAVQSEPGGKSPRALTLERSNTLGKSTLIFSRLRTDFPEARVIMLTSSEAEEDVRHALEAGASGYVTKNVRRAELFEAIRECHAGGRPIGENVARLLAAGSEHGVVSRREMEVLALVRQGFTNAEVGRLLGITERTAKAHVAALLVKLQASDRAEAVARGFERGLLKP